MESTGLYWLPVYALEGHFELIVGNSRHIRNMPGRKTDVKDSEWIADLVRSGPAARPLRRVGARLRTTPLACTSVGPNCLAQVTIKPPGLIFALKPVVG